MGEAGEEVGGGVWRTSAIGAEGVRRSIDPLQTDVEEGAVARMELGEGGTEAVGRTFSSSATAGGGV